MKLCIRCNQVKQLNLFSKNSSKPDGFSTYCKLCMKEINHSHYLRNKDRYKSNAITSKNRLNQIICASKIKDSHTVSKTVSPVAESGRRALCDKYSGTLGMNVSTATHILRMNIIYDMACNLGLSNCIKCGTGIDNPRDLSIDHKEPWRLISSDLFWDLDNIGFSHKRCNKVDRPKGGSGANGSIANRKIGPVGTSWCMTCQDFLPVDIFHKNSSRFNGLAHECKLCHNRRLGRQVKVYNRVVA